MKIDPLKNLITYLQLNRNDKSLQSWLQLVFTQQVFLETAFYFLVFYFHLGYAMNFFCIVSLRGMEGLLSIFSFAVFYFQEV